MFDDQSGFRERFEGGEAGMRRLAPLANIVVVVDVLSFSTAVDVAVGRGATIFPFSERGAAAAGYARERGAIAASNRGSASSPFSLSPSSLVEIPSGTRLVLPSPNGAMLVLLAADLGTIVLAGCLRNAKATAAACRALDGSVAIIAAGERWRVTGGEMGSLRPAVEDLVGAGAILHALSPTHPSPEALAAIGAFRAVPDLDRFIRECASSPWTATAPRTTPPTWRR
jgi:2-phosphosulfolactate phosphatase